MRRINHEQTFVLIVPAKVRRHANKIIIAVTAEEWIGQRGIVHMQQLLDSDEERKVLRFEIFEGRRELQLALRCELLFN